MTRLILWDVDGTLVQTGGHGSRALKSAAATVAGLKDVPHVHMHGKTDPQILREILELAELPHHTIEELLPDAIRHTEEKLAVAEGLIARDGKPHPGVREALEALSRTAGVRQTLLTGNLAANAVIKVAAFDLDRFFDIEIGAYGTDHADRNELVPIALARVKNLRGETYDPTEVWVIGDTERDLECARVAGVRCLLVGTGFVGGIDALRDLGADEVLEDLTDTERVLEILLG